MVKYKFANIESEKILIIVEVEISRRKKFNFCTNNATKNFSISVPIISRREETFFSNANFDLPEAIWFYDCWID